MLCYSSLSQSAKSFVPSFHQWGVTPNFNPLAASCPSLVNYQSKRLHVTQGMAVDNSHISKFVNSVFDSANTTVVSLLVFRKADTFEAGNLQQHLSPWERLASVAPYNFTPNVLNWIKNSFVVQKFFKHFKGSFRGRFSLPFPHPSPEGLFELPFV